MKNIITTLIILILFNVNLLATAAVGTITSLRGDVKVKNKTSVIKAKIGLELYEKNSILTGEKSKAQLIFKDDTIITVGKNSNFSISQFLYEQSKEPVAKFNLLQGAIKTMTGKIGKIAPQKFSVRTKTATIGIRGTNFTVSVLGNQSLMAYCTYGAINVNYHNKNYLVKKGFYIIISSMQKIKIYPFNAKELKEMSTKLFGKMHLVKGKTTKDSTYFGNGVIIDGTTQRDTHLETTLDEVVKSKEQSDTEDIITQKSTQQITMNGLDVIHDRYNNLISQVSLKFLADGSHFDQELSYIDANDVSNLSGNGETDDWSFTLAETPQSFTSEEDFSTNFTSVLLIPHDGSSSTDATLEPGSRFIATADDLEDGDYMSWGTWSADVSFTSTQSGIPISDQHHFNGLWIAGDTTDPAVVEALTTTRGYEGIYRAFEIENNTKYEGTAQMLVDFGADTANLTIQNLNGHDYHYENMSLYGNTFAGEITNAAGADAKGYSVGEFYGPNAQEAGGNFQVYDQDNGIDAKGVYELKESSQITAP